MASHKHPDKKDETANPPTGGAGAVEEPESIGASGDAAADQIQKLLAENRDLMNTLVRRQADFENYRKRVEKERQQDRHRSLEGLIEKILPVLDAFELALARSNAEAVPEFRKGFELIYRQMVDILSKQGLKRIESAGQEFDPHFHHAIQRVETTEQRDGTVLEELQPGYLFHDRVLRPAMVRVAVAPASESISDAKFEN